MGDCSWPNGFFFACLFSAASISSSIESISFKSGASIWSLRENMRFNLSNWSSVNRFCCNAEAKMLSMPPRTAKMSSCTDLLEQLVLRQQVL